MKDMRTLCVERQVRASKHAVNVTAMRTRLLNVNTVDRLRAGLTRIPRSNLSNGSNAIFQERNGFDIRTGKCVLCTMYGE